VQYAHVPDALALWDVWTVIAGPPVAFEPPSAGFLLDWTGLSAIRARGASFATLTHAAGLSSTGDPALDARLPLAEPYRIPARTAALVRQTRARGGRVIAIGTTVVRALEHAATRGLLEGPHPIESIADQRLGSGTALQVVDVLVSGTHEPGTSHHELLRAFVPDERLAHTDRALAAARFRTHEFGDSVWLERVARQPSE
jgi:S-adenosylmethionine:tRNA ribosyltransferase-isomerase